MLSPYYRSRRVRCFPHKFNNQFSSPPSTTYYQFRRRRHLCLTVLVWLRGKLHRKIGSIILTFSILPVLDYLFLHSSWFSRYYRHLIVSFCTTSRHLVIIGPSSSLQPLTSIFILLQPVVFRLHCNQQLKLPTKIPAACCYLVCFDYFDCRPPSTRRRRTSTAYYLSVSAF